MTVYFYQIEEAERAVEETKSAYLQRWGWTLDCNSPGAFWLWKRDFADEDAKRKAWDDKHGAGKPGGPSASRPYGIIMGPTDLAVSMTARVLDGQPEIDGDGE